MILTEEENEALKKLKDSISYTGNGYKMGVLWKENKPLLPDNHHTALSRLCNTENKLKKNCALGTEYSQIIQAYVEKGYLRRVEPDEPLPPEVCLTFQSSVWTKLRLKYALCSIVQLKRTVCH